MYTYLTWSRTSTKTRGKKSRNNNSGPVLAEIPDAVPSLPCLPLDIHCPLSAMVNPILHNTLHAKPCNKLHDERNILFKMGDLDIYSMVFMNRGELSSKLQTTGKRKFFNRKETTQTPAYSGYHYIKPKQNKTKTAKPTEIETKQKKCVRNVNKPAEAQHLVGGSSLFAPGAPTPRGTSHGVKKAALLIELRMSNAGPASCRTPVTLNGEKAVMSAKYRSKFPRESNMGEKLTVTWFEPSL